MITRVQRLERQRDDLVERSREQRLQLVAYGVSAAAALRRMRLLVFVARIAARFQRLRDRTGL